MLLSKRLRAVLLAAVLVAGLLVGFGGSDEAVAKEPRATIGKIMIPAAAFTPTTDDWDYATGGYYVTAFGSTGHFTAPVWFPVPEVYIRKVMLLAYDNTGGDSNRVCLSLDRAQPLKANYAGASYECTADSADDPQKVVSTTLFTRRFYTANHGSYLWATIDPETTLYGVQVAYSY